MPKVMIIECSDEEADRLVEQIKGIVTALILCSLKH